MKFLLQLRFYKYSETLNIASETASDIPSLDENVFNQIINQLGNNKACDHQFVQKIFNIILTIGNVSQS